MTCPHCGCGRVRTVDSRPYGAQVLRRKECRSCLERFSTLEIPVEEYKDLKSKATELKLRYGK